MHENELARQAVDVAYHIHSRLGPGLFESVYCHLMVYELSKRGLAVQAEVPIPLIWNELTMEVGFRADLIIESKLILEIKSLESLAPVHHKQLLTYLKLANYRLGLLINFGSALIKDGVVRIVNGLTDELTT